MLEKLRAGASLSERERQTHEQGLVSVLRQLHDELDAAAAAYGYPPDLSDEEILSRLVALKAERARRTARLHRLAPPRISTPDHLARLFQHANRDRSAELLDTLVSLGQARARRSRAVAVA